NCRNQDRLNGEKNPKKTGRGDYPPLTNLGHIDVKQVLHSKHCKLSVEEPYLLQDYRKTGWSQLKKQIRHQYCEHNRPYLNYLPTQPLLTPIDYRGQEAGSRNQWCPTPTRWPHHSQDYRYLRQYTIQSYQSC